MEMPNNRAREQKFACEDIHSDLSTLSGTIVEYFPYSDRGVLDRATWVDLVRHHIEVTAFKHHMAQLMRDQKGTVELCAIVFEEYDAGVTIENGLSTLQQWISRFDRIDLKPTPLCFTLNELQQVLSAVTGHNRCAMDSFGFSAGGFGRVHWLIPP
jgi:hypothetical protein